MRQNRKPQMAVWKFASCDGCQLSFLDLEDWLLEITDRIDVVWFREMTSAASQGPFDISLVDGSITTPEDLAQIHEVRKRSGYLVSLGACATSGGIQALRNFANVSDYAALVYASPEYISTLSTSTGISDHVPVDFELRGCPVNAHQLLEVINAWLNRRRPAISGHSVCVECKRRGNVCVLVTGTPCLGPVTHAGCGALCPTYQRGCYGCYGPMEAANTPSLATWLQDQTGVPRRDVQRLFRNFNANAPEFRRQSEALGEEPEDG